MALPEEMRTAAVPPVVLHVTECPVGGVSRAIELAIRAAPDVAHVVLAPPQTIRTQEAGAVFRPLPEGHRGRIRAVERLAKEVRATAIHAHSSWAGVYARLAGLSIPILYQPHCFAFSDVTKPRLIRCAYWLAERMMARRTSAVVALTPHEERQARRLGIKRVHQVSNAPTVQVPRASGRSPLAERSSIKKVVMVGRIAPQKDPVFFADIARFFLADSTVEFVWLGDVGQGADYRHGRAALERAGVTITGWLGDGELVAWLRNADVYVHSAAYEGFPLSLLDACALGVPSIVRDIPSLSECGLPQFSGPVEAAELVRRLLTSRQMLERVARSSTALSDSMGVEAHYKDVRQAYSSHGLLRTGIPETTPR